MTENKVTVTQALTAKRDRVHPSNRRPDLPMMLKISFGDLETIIDALAQHRTRSVGEGEPFAWTGSVSWHKPAHRAVMASVKIGSWLSAALEDPKVCDEMKADIHEWFSAGEPMETLCQALASPKTTDSVDAVREALETIAALDTGRKDQGGGRYSDGWAAASIVAADIARKALQTQPAARDVVEEGK